MANPTSWHLTGTRRFKRATTIWLLLHAVSEYDLVAQHILQCCKLGYGAETQFPAARSNDWALCLSTSTRFVSFADSFGYDQPTKSFACGFLKSKRRGYLCCISCKVSTLVFPIYRFIYVVKVCMYIDTSIKLVMVHNSFLYIGGLLLLKAFKQMLITYINLPTSELPVNQLRHQFFFIDSYQIIFTAFLSLLLLIVSAPWSKSVVNQAREPLHSTEICLEL